MDNRIVIYRFIHCIGIHLYTVVVIADADETAWRLLEEYIRREGLSLNEFYTINNQFIMCKYQAGVGAKFHVYE